MKIIKVKANGVSIYISHDYTNRRHCDRITVLRDGELVGTVNNADVTGTI